MRNSDFFQDWGQWGEIGCQEGTGRGGQMNANTSPDPWLGHSLGFGKTRETPDPQGTMGKPLALVNRMEHARRFEQWKASGEEGKNYENSGS